MAAIPSQTARALNTSDRRQVVRIHGHHITEDQLDAAIRHVINAYHRFALPHFWGFGRHAAADGATWDLYEQNLLAEYHIRYCGYGGIGTTRPPIPSVYRWRGDSKRGTEDRAKVDVTF